MNGHSRAPGIPEPGRPTVVEGTEKSPNMLALAIVAVAFAVGYVAFFIYMEHQSDRGFEPANLIPLIVPVSVAAFAPFLVKRARDRRTPMNRIWLEVTDDRICLSTGGALGREWRKSDGDLVTVTGRKKRMMMAIGSTGDMPLSLREFDVMVSGSTSTDRAPSTSVT